MTRVEASRGTARRAVRADEHGRDAVAQQRQVGVCRRVGGGGGQGRHPPLSIDRCPGRGRRPGPAGTVAVFSLSSLENPPPGQPASGSRSDRRTGQIRRSARTGPGKAAPAPSPPDTFIRGWARDVGRPAPNERNIGTMAGRRASLGDRARRGRRRPPPGPRRQGWRDGDDLDTERIGRPGQGRRRPARPAVEPMEPRALLAVVVGAVQAERRPRPPRRSRRSRGPVHRRGCDLSPPTWGCRPTWGRRPT